MWRRERLRGAAASAATWRGGESTYMFDMVVKSGYMGRAVTFAATLWREQLHAMVARWSGYIARRGERLHDIALREYCESGYITGRRERVHGAAVRVPTGTGTWRSGKSGYMTWSRERLHDLAARAATCQGGASGYMTWWRERLHDMVARGAA